MIWRVWSCSLCLHCGSDVYRLRAQIAGLSRNNNCCSESFRERRYFKCPSEKRHRGCCTQNRLYVTNKHFLVHVYSKVRLFVERVWAHGFQEERLGLLVHVTY